MNKTNILLLPIFFTLFIFHSCKDKAKNYIYIKKISGTDTTIKRSLKSIIPKRQLKIEESDKIITRGDTYLILSIFSFARIRIGPNSEIIVKSGTNQKTSLLLNKGEIFLDFKKPTLSSPELSVKANGTTFKTIESVQFFIVENLKTKIVRAASLSGKLQYIIDLNKMVNTLDSNEGVEITDQGQTKGHSNYAWVEYLNWKRIAQGINLTINKKKKKSSLFNLRKGTLSYRIKSYADSLAERTQSFQEDFLDKKRKAKKIELKKPPKKKKEYIHSSIKEAFRTNKPKKISKEKYYKKLEEVSKDE